MRSTAFTYGVALAALLAPLAAGQPDTGDRVLNVEGVSEPQDSAPIAPGLHADITFSSPGNYVIISRDYPWLTMELDASDRATTPLAPGPQPTAHVTIEEPEDGTSIDWHFNPGQLTVPPGAIVRFHNDGTRPHTLTYGTVDRQPLVPQAPAKPLDSLNLEEDDQDSGAAADPSQPEDSASDSASRSLPPFVFYAAGAIAIVAISAFVAAHYRSRRERAFWTNRFHDDQRR